MNNVNSFSQGSFSLSSWDLVICLICIYPYVNCPDVLKIILEGLRVRSRGQDLALDIVWSFSLTTF